MMSRFSLKMIRKVGREKEDVVRRLAYEAVASESVFFLPKKRRQLSAKPV
jgi:hypothetical protein